MAADGKQAMSSLRILLAEDNAMNQKVALRLLERLGYRADLASNGLEALAALERQPYDVVLMDVQMPELDGLDATRRICERWPPESRPHIIAMTANALPGGSRGLLRGRHERLRREADPRGRAGGGAQTRAAASEPRRRFGEPARSASRLPRSRICETSAAIEFLAEVVDAFLADAPALITSPPELARAAGHRGAPPSGAHAEVERLDPGRGGVRGALPHRRAARQGRPPRRRLGSSSDRIEQEYRTLQEALASLRSEPVS